MTEEADHFFEDAPCGYLSSGLDGTIVRVNRTFESWTGLRRENLLSAARFQDLLSPGGRIFYETHVGPLLRIRGSVREVALDVVRADGSVLTTLVNATLRTGGDGRPAAIDTTVFDATERRRYEQDLLAGARREQEIARELQRSMLAGELPLDPRVELSVGYHPGVRGLEVGGDWYDAFWLVDGRTVGLVVGDVVGRGVAAAATMGQLRSAVRAFAATGLDPGSLLDGLHGYARRHGVGRMATLVYAVLELGSGELRYACAGHPPPLIAVPGEAPCFAWGGRSTPLDVRFRATAARPQAALTLPAGSTVVLYTDGLVERRSQPLSEGMERLRGQVELRREADPATLTSAIVRELHSAAADDDVCLLAARVSPAGRPL